jgi:hypothetical protein
MLEFLVLLKLLSSKTHDELTCTADPPEEKMLKNTQQSMHYSKNLNYP